MVNNLYRRQTFPRFGLFVFLMMFLMLTGGLWSDQKSDPSLLCLDRIFDSDDFRSQRFGPARWLEDGTGYTTLEKSQEVEDGRDIVQYNPKTGERTILVPVTRLIPEGESKPLEIANYIWSTNMKKLLIFTNTKRVWRADTKGDYWILDLSNWTLNQLGAEFEPSSLMFAKFSPEADRVAYVQQNNIYVEDLETHKLTRLTWDGSETTINGTFDWVYEEELSLRDGFRWSPDGRHIAYWQLDTEGVKDFYLVNNTESLYPKITKIPYPKPGERNSACRVGVVSSDGGYTRWLNVPGDSRNNYIARMDWAANPDEVVIQQLNRLQNRNKVMLANIHSGDIQTILVEQDEAWVDVHDDLHWLEDGWRFTWMSERDGWRHVYVYDRSGQNSRLVTPGQFDVIRVEHIDKEGKWLYYTASPDNPTQRYLYRVRLDGKKKPERLSPDDVSGTHSYQISPGAGWAFHTYSNFDTPAFVELISLPDHKAVRFLAENAGLKQKVNALKRRPTEFFRVDIGGGVFLDVWCMKPFDFDPEKKYPVLFYVYGEPWGQTVTDRWSGNRFLWHLMLTQQGYIVMSVDNRGTRAPRGRAWRKIIYRQIGILASEDQAAALRAIIRQKKYVDPSRVGIWGWSGGGSMSLNMIFRYPGLYHTAMSVAPVPDQRFYDSIYQERYMGLPKDNEEGYTKGSPITFAHQLEGNLLIVHGTGDDNVHYQGTEALINALIEANKPFTMMAYPNRSHGISEGKNTTLHLYELLTRYLKKNLPAGPRK
jgi:dipeptidyl-peptidase-4